MDVGVGIIVVSHLHSHASSSYSIMELFQDFWRCQPLNNDAVHHRTYISIDRTCQVEFHELSLVNDTCFRVNHQLMYLMMVSEEFSSF